MSKTDTSHVHEGDRFSLIRYCQVTELRDTKFTVKTDDGQYWQVDKGIVERTCYTANQFTEEVQLSKTDIAKCFEQAGDTIFTVMFHKKVKPEDVAETIGSLEENPAQWNQTKRRKLARDLLAGEERVLKGYLKSPEPDIYGRVKVHDLEVAEGTNERLVDPRTIEWLILKNIKYVVKK